mmetsp:Transcript_10173/g.11679  ORF Transcript_10173/g.11679 Transcript_10173/m.11679 type:complete len:399 (+) Transcript_10173:230-1426(+)
MGVDDVAHVGLKEEEFQCTLCLKLLYKPTTTICGHSFCIECLTRSLRFRAKCPICRSVLHASFNRLAVSTDFSRLLEANFPKEYSLRRKDEEEKLSANRISPEANVAASNGEEENAVLGTMVLCPVLPRQRLHLHIYEPRYRLLTQRCLEGSRRFGMLARSGRGRSPASYGTEVEIVECEPLPGGRYYMEVVGRRVFRVVDSWSTDEYLRCRVEWIDLDEGEGPHEANGFNTRPIDPERTLAMSHNLESLVEIWQGLVYERGYERNPDQLRRLYRDLGPMPPYTAPGDRAMWVAALINPLPALGVAPEIRPSMLQATNVLERVEIATEGIRSSLIYMKPTLFRTVLSSGVTQLQKLLSFLFRHSWLILLGWWLAQRFPNFMPLPKSSLLLALRMVPPS